MSLKNRIVNDPRRTTTVLAVAAAVLVLLAAVLTVIAGGKDGREDSRNDALKGATEAVETLLSYDFRTVETAVADNKDLVTGKFGEEYPAYVSETLAPPVLERRLENVTSVAEGAIVSGSGDEVVVLLFLNQRFGVVGQSDQQSAGSRVRVTVREVDGDWRIAELAPV